MRAALTGHLLLSTLHTNNAPLAITRLVDMGIQPFLVLSSLNGIVAQRLLRRLCPACRRVDAPSEGQLRLLGLERIAEGVTVYRANGCPECGGLGYKGRVAVYEFLEISNEMRRVPVGQLSPEHLRALAQREGYVSLRESAVRKYLEGVTSAREVLALTTEE
jgi:type II secretory ATPase GspE/PulE/Tfp pilus assembly ATPase PilB-like protein